MRILTKQPIIHQIKRRQNPLHRYISRSNQTNSNTKINGEQLLNTWIKTLQTKSPIQMSALYSKNAILLPTLDPTIKNTPQKIEKYFESFLAKHPQCTVEQVENIALSNNETCVVGHYLFTFTNSTETSSSIPATGAIFTFIYDENGLITHHHSSLKP